MKILKNIVSFSAVVAAIIYGIIMFFKGTSDLYQYMILSLLILIATSSLIMDIQYTSKFECYFEKLNWLIETSTIQCFDSVDLCAKELSSLVKSGTHIVDFVSIDTEIRTTNKKKSGLMHQTVQSLFQNENIRLTYITMLRQDTIERFIKNIDLGDLGDNDNMYAYFNSDNAIPFATFLIVDSKIVITRSPYRIGQNATYIIIRNETLSKHYKEWTSFIWESAKKVESADDIDAIYSLIKDSISGNRKTALEKHIASIKKKLER